MQSSPLSMSSRTPGSRPATIRPGRFNPRRELGGGLSQRRLGRRDHQTEGMEGKPIFAHGGAAFARASRPEPGDEYSCCLSIALARRAIFRSVRLAQCADLSAGLPRLSRRARLHKSRRRCVTAPAQSGLRHHLPRVVVVSNNWCYHPQMKSRYLSGAPKVFRENGALFELKQGV